ncbi:MAG: endopeptidase La [Gemmatimonadetes bacterium]|uniref:Lon protease n=1 Tax=Candidatus Kutchimonas denitrificans TaxID=3056748 RepID=A0AAE4Z7B9_9BACT|nr:endopeptidase La [Gemmatimonadota bacterium]NIR74933.1 endopeptidase La [Candidatus Kutchimonas denitrificans]NIT65628.1 endopeptidase La [Gemmatimonadota bacterium]NIV22355.1 endopeptidase La [Gemmatimonadota bacterium]NIW74099.1 endopeptidase La [Gemmatimonadota bacterium]
MRLPVLPLRETVVFPGVTAPIVAGRDKTLRAIEHALSADEETKRIFAVAQRENVDEPTADILYNIGVICRIAQIQRFPGGLQLLLEGEGRATALQYAEGGENVFLEAIVTPLADQGPLNVSDAAFQGLFREVSEKAAELGRHRGVPEEIIERFIRAVEEPGALSDHVAYYMELGSSEKQELLETTSVELRLRRILVHLYRQIAMLEAQEHIRTRVQEELGERQREIYLREQLKAIRRELGEEDSDAEIEELRERLETLELPGEAREEVDRELRRLERVNRESAEAQVIRTYLEWIADLPWNERSEDQLDIEKARVILDEDHYGLDDVKERILEFLAVGKMRRERAEGAEEKAKAMAAGPILLFLGPPGTGKTSVAKSIARALGREYVRVSLGGARDEADIRGHRRTYVGAMPGRIIQGMKRAGTKNPVFLLDEVDKLGASFQGDPSAALLEVLDPAQNNSFTDHYLGVGFDLSEVLFVCTANFGHQIPAPLMDRMEGTDFSGYTELEKLEIAKRYLLPRQRDESGLSEEQLTVTDDALLSVINEWTREAGVRQLERELGSLARKAAREIAEGGATEIAVDRDNLRDLLGKPKARPEKKLPEPQVGVATGMTYTQVGGDIIFVEASTMPGKGNLVLTGQLGDVMKESARAGLTFAQTHHRELGIAEERLRDIDVHVHVPAGAVPKDGPSAGITMATALVSAMSDRPARNDVAMTGELTLTGRVLPIGGLKEKVLGACRAGITDIILPKENERDIEEIPEEARCQLTFHPVETLSEVLAVALEGVTLKDGKLVFDESPPTPAGAEVLLQEASDGGSQPDAVN